MTEIPNNNDNDYTLTDSSDEITTKSVTDVTVKVTNSVHATNATSTGTTVTAHMTSVPSKSTHTDLVTNATGQDTTQFRKHQTTEVTENETTDIIVHETTDVTPYGLSSESGTDAFFKSVTTAKTETSTTSLPSQTAQNHSLTSTSPHTPMISSSSAPISSTLKTEGQQSCTDGMTVAIVATVSVTVVVLVMLTSVVCFLRLRHKWRSKIQLERKKTDIWSMATFNNTIINENFNDYHLASPRPDMRKSSAFSETSVRIYDPFSGSAPHTQFSFDSDRVTPPANVHEEFHFDDSTLRRNTFSAPSQLNSSAKTLSKQDSSNPSDKRFTLRDRSSTFTVGKKHKSDKHVLLSHEEVVDNNTPGHFGHLQATPTQSYYVTEL